MVPATEFSPRFESPSVGPRWDDFEAFVVGSGPSLSPWADRVPELREHGILVGVNAAAELVDTQVCFTIDREFHARSVPRMVRQGRDVIVGRTGDQHDWPWHQGVIYVEQVYDWPDGYLRPHRLARTLHSGAGAVQFAVLKGARIIRLLGFDLNGTPGRWHDGYSWSRTSNDNIYHRKWAGEFGKLAEALPEGVRIINHNPSSAVRQFEMSTYEELFA